MDGKGGFTLPFNERNPLNYVRPITVNIYFKQSVPGVGTYDPQVVEKNPITYNGQFKSNTDRNTNQKYFNQQKLVPGPSTYDHINGFDLSFKERDKGSGPFKDPVPKKIVPINLYNPH